MRSPRARSRRRAPSSAPTSRSSPPRSPRTCPSRRPSRRPRRAAPARSARTARPARPPAQPPRTGDPATPSRPRPPRRRTPRPSRETSPVRRRPRARPAASAAAAAGAARARAKAARRARPRTARPKPHPRPTPADGAAPAAPELAQGKKATPRRKPAQDRSAAPAAGDEAGERVGAAGQAQAPPSPPQARGHGRRVDRPPAEGRGRLRVARKGIILAGGSGTRLYPVTRVVSKQLLPVYDKPMIYYPLSTLMLAGIREILVITTPHDAPAVRAPARRRLALGPRARLRAAAEPRRARAGVPDRARLPRRRSRRCLVLGDNIFYGHGLTDVLRAASARETGATVFGYRVRDPERYGVVEFDADGRAIGLEEKPAQPKSQLRRHRALLLRRQRAATIAAALTPSPRGELEITDLNRALPRARRAAWSSASAAATRGSTPARTSRCCRPRTSSRRSSSARASRSPAPRRSPTRTAGSTRDRLLALAEPLRKNGYGQYLLALADGAFAGTD